MASSASLALNPCDGSAHYQAAMKVANDLISTSMRNIVQARLRNIEKRNRRIHTFPQEHPDKQLP